MNKEDLFKFCEKWLTAWTGNNPDELLSFYGEEALYSDPAHRNGLRGKDAIREYFVRLLDVYRDWQWKPLEVFPIETGVIVKWECKIPIGPETIHETGLDIVEIENGRIIRNEVYFDRTRLVSAIDKKRRDERLINL